MCSYRAQASKIFTPMLVDLCGLDPCIEINAIALR